MLLTITIDDDDDIYLYLIPLTSVMKIMFLRFTIKSTWTTIKLVIPSTLLRFYN